MIMKMNQTIWSFVCLLLFALPASAAKVVWQSIPNNIHVTSGGEAFDTSVTFEIGTFAPGFVPRLSNRAQWASQWTVLDRTTYNPTTKFFASTVQFDSNEVPFVAGRRAYIWGSTGGFSRNGYLRQTAIGSGQKLPSVCPRCGIWLLPPA